MEPHEQPSALINGNKRPESNHHACDHIFIALSPEPHNHVVIMIAFHCKRRYGTWIGSWKHACLQAALRGQGALLGAEQMASEASMNGLRLREHQAVVRAVDNYWLAELFRQRLLNDPQRTYPGMLLTWVRQVIPHSPSPSPPPPPPSGGCKCCF